MSRLQFSCLMSSLCSLCLCGSLFGAEPKAPAKITYDEHVLPLLRDKCLSCHNADKKNAATCVLGVPRRPAHGGQ